MTGYSNSRVDALLDRTKGEMVTCARNAPLEEAWRIVTGDLVDLPVRHGVSVFSMRKDLEIPPDRGRGRAYAWRGSSPQAESECRLLGRFC
jgi:hypothetical protein